MDEEIKQQRQFMAACIALAIASIGGIAGSGLVVGCGVIGLIITFIWVVGGY